MAAVQLLPVMVKALVTAMPRYIDSINNIHLVLYLFIPAIDILSPGVHSASSLSKVQHWQWFTSQILQYSDSQSVSSAACSLYILLYLLSGLL